MTRQRMFRATFYPKSKLFYTDNVPASVTNSMSASQVLQIFGVSITQCQPGRLGRQQAGWNRITSLHQPAVPSSIPLIQHQVVTKLGPDELQLLCFLVCLILPDSVLPTKIQSDAG